MIKSLLQIALFLTISFAMAQPKMELTAQGFAPINLPTPNKTNELLIEFVKGWTEKYNKKGYDIYDVTENSIAIEANKDNAFYYVNLGESFQYRIRYTLKVVFKADKTYTLSFLVKEIYDKDKRLETTISDYFTSDGKLKEDFEEVKPSLETTANNIIRSFTEYIAK